MSELSFLAIAIGGGLGSVARFVVSREMGNWFGNYLPYGTLTVNVLGSLVLGWLATVLPAWSGSGISGCVYHFFSV